MAQQELVTAYTLSDPVTAEIIKNFLHSEGIKCFLDGINQAGEAGLNIMTIKVQVPADDVDRAQKLIRAHEIHRD